MRKAGQQHACCLGFHLARIHQRTLEFFGSGRDGYACLLCNTISTLDTVGFLIQKGADVKVADNDGLTPLHRAVAAPGTYRAAVANCLIKSGAEIGATDNNGLSCLQLMEGQVRNSPSDVQLALVLAEVYLQRHENELSAQVLQRVLDEPILRAGTVLRIAELLSQAGDLTRLEPALERLAQVSPDSPEAWYDLAAVKVSVRKDEAALVALSRALDLSDKRREHEASARNLRLGLGKDERFARLRQTEDFQKLSRAEQ